MSRKKTNKTNSHIGCELAVGFELRVRALDTQLPARLVKLTPVGPDYLTGGIQGPEVGSSAPWFLLVGSRITFRVQNEKWRYCASGAEISVPGGGVNSNMEAGTGPCV